jgi:hypothetical protein
MRLALAALCLCLGSGAVAQQVDRSPRPPENPRLAVASVDPRTPTDLGLQASALGGPAEGGVAEPVETGDVLLRSLRPQPRPVALVEGVASLRAATKAPGLDLSTDQGAEAEIAAAPPLTRKEKRRKKREAASMEGSVCGVASIKGEEIAAIGSKVKGCGVPEAVRVTSVAGVRLSQAATVDCSVATALNTWVDEVAQPAFDGRLSELRIAAHYICRSRNNVKGAKISEHGKGRAIDISAFVLTDGRVLTVADNYNRTLRKIYKAACGIFKTTLGPGSDGYHEDHFHFDTSARKGGAYCR